MKLKNFAAFLFIAGIFIFQPVISAAQSYLNWYNNAQARIDTMRKGDFGIQIIDKNGETYSGPVSVRMKKHEFPFGIAFDFYEGEVSMGYKFSTNSKVEAESDNEIYRTERYGKHLAYEIPVESGKEYKVTLKLAEIYFGTANSRLFDVAVEGELFLDNFDIYAQAGGKNIAIDSSMIITTTRNFIHIEITASRDNAAIKGIVIEEVGSENIIRINCGGAALTTSDGNAYESGRKKIGRDVIGKKRPQRKIIGNRKKLENVCASNTSLTETAINSPKKVELMAMSTIVGTRTYQFIADKSVKNNATKIGTRAFIVPNRIAPDVLANIKSSSEMGASRRRSKDLPFFSKVTVTERTLVVPKRILSATRPGSKSGSLSIPMPERIKNIVIQTKGNSSPQLILGGFR